MNLPDKPSELILLALHDLEAVEKSPNYNVKMSLWHQKVDGVCNVCFAGSVMAMSCGIPDDKGVGWNVDMESLGDFSLSDSRKFEALNSFRTGDIESALKSLDIPHPVDLPDEFDVHFYDLTPEEFKEDMRNLAQLLQQHNL